MKPKFTFTLPENPGYYNRFGFPYRTTLSFTPIIKSLEEKVKSGGHAQQPLIALLHEVKQIPELNAPIEDLSILKKYERQVKLLMATVIPPSLAHTLNEGVIIPFQPITVFATSKFAETIPANEEGIWNMTGMNLQSVFKQLIAIACTHIMEKYYGVVIDRPDFMKFRVSENQENEEQFFKPEVITEFSTVSVLKEPRPMAELDLSPLNEDYFDVECWLKNFPPDTFEFYGLVVYRMFDVRERETIAALETSLLQSESIITKAGIGVLQKRLRQLFKVKDLRVGLAPMFNNMVPTTDCGDDYWHCIIPAEKMKTIVEHFEQSIYAKVVESGEPLLIADLTKLYPSKVEQELMDQGIISIIVAPIFNDKNLIGILEVGSGKRDAFDFNSMLRLKNILPLISVVLQRNARDYDNRIQALIKQHFTSIHPSVEWKFVQTATQVMREEDGDKPSSLPVIEFNNVYPLYGQVDIRSSSDTRLEAIRLDMIDYLHAALQLIEVGEKQVSLVILDELRFRINQYLDQLKQGLDTGHETEIIDFIHRDVEPALTILVQHDPSMEEATKNFLNGLSPQEGLFNKRRHEFELSLSAINQLAAQMLDEEEERTQRWLPHYFEKYKTDGVEYNIYIGESLLQEKKFDPVLLNNFRLWQLINMVSITRETNKLKQLLSVPLETTQLILCYSNPFSIMFRQDEKRFDVAGAYNIRYEIVKKRIDKAHVKDTNERITQPHKIAIVYTQDKEATEYERYFTYMKHKGMITDDVEHLDVEPLQGMVGLKCLRITVNYETTEPSLQYDEEELFKQVKDMMV